MSKPQQKPSDSRGCAARPAAGDLLLYRHPVYGTSGHVGVVLAGGKYRVGVVLAGGKYRVKTSEGRVRRVPAKLVEGWWPKGARLRSLAALRQLEPSRGVRA